MVVKRRMQQDNAVARVKLQYLHRKVMYHAVVVLVIMVVVILQMMWKIDNWVTEEKRCSS